MKQLTLAAVGFERYAKTTRRAAFLAEMERVVPWPALCALIEPFYPKPGNGRPPVGVERMLRIYFLQQWFNLSDPAVEEALYDSLAMRRFVDVDLGREPVPDETTVCRFRHLLEEHDLGQQLFDEVQRHLAAKGLKVATGTIVDATIISAPSSTKNAEKARDPKMRQTKKGNQWYFGMKAHLGVYVFDLWMRREYPDILFERYADDAICHCRSEAQALELRQALEKRFADCKLQLHPQKTKVVYCKDANRPGHYPEQSFDFLGYTFRPRLASNRHGERFVAFIPAVSKQAVKKMRLSVRRWRMHRRNDLELAQIAAWVRPVLTGWVRYFGRFYPSKLQEELRTIDAFIVRWAIRKYKRFRGQTMAIWDWLRSLKRRDPALFAHWTLGPAVR